VTFEAAALRAAQIGFDLSVKTPMAFFSWPSRGQLKWYAADETAMEKSADAIEEFLVSFAQIRGIASINVIAHSIGNRGLLNAISSIVTNAERQSHIHFGQIILAAADEAYPVDSGIARCSV
jgi:esterase/lipase superfamily enzyme